MTTIFMFPGQSSHYPRCLEKLLAFDPLAGRIVEEAADILHRDLASEFRSDNPDIFSTNQRIHVGVFLTNFIYGRLLGQAGVVAAASLGQGLGEYNHLAEIGVLTFADGLRLVAERGALYDEAPPGMLASVGPIDANALEGVLRGVGGQVTISNFNSPTQHVIGGSCEAVGAALAALEADHFVQASIIEPNIAMHTPLFAGISRRFRTVLEGVDWQPAKKPYLPNATATPVVNPTPEAIVSLLSEHVCRPVLWRQAVERLAASYADAVFVEVGARSVLFNLQRRQWLPNRRLKVDSDINAPPAIESVAAALTRARTTA